MPLPAQHLLTQTGEGEESHLQAEVVYTTFFVPPTNGDCAVMTSNIKIAIPKETIPNEQRVSLVPSSISELKKFNCELMLQKGAGLSADYLDEQYGDIDKYDNVATLYAAAKIILKVQPPTEKEIALIPAHSIIIGFMAPDRNLPIVAALRDKKITSFAMELIPRISRAQNMDALSSQASVAGYKAALIAANLSKRFFPMLTTAAGTIRPQNVLILGAGVAGLQAIATAKRLGAIVKAYDIRSAAREQIESLGAKMLDISIQAEGTGGYARELTAEEKQQQQLLLQNEMAKSEIIISTAQIPGKPAPIMITKEMLNKMAPGSIIIDLAAETGGNCELTKKNEIYEYNGVTIYGITNIPSMVARDASNLYAKNLVNFLHLLLTDNPELKINWDDEIFAKSVLTHDGEIKHAPTKELLTHSP